MIKIDLLPKEERRRKPALAPKVRVPRERRVAVGPRLPVGIDTIIILVVFLLAVGAMYLVFTGQKREIARLEDEITAMKAELKKLQDAVQLVRNLEEKERAIKVKLEVIAKLNKDRFLRAHMMDELSRLLPENSWLSSIVEKKPSLTIEGFTFSNFTVADYMRKLETSKYIKNVDLSVLNKEKAGGHDVMKFKLTSSLVPYSPPRAPAGAAKKEEG
ncbi:MAG: PilN domain-containing protein [bacterium]